MILFIYLFICLCVCVSVYVCIYVSKYNVGKGVYKQFDKDYLKWLYHE